MLKQKAWTLYKAILSKRNRVLALFLERGAYPGKFYTTLISCCWDRYFLFKRIFQKQLWKIYVNQEYKLLRCLSSIYTLPSPKSNHRMSHYLVIVYQRERFAKIVGFHLSAPKYSLKNPHPQRWKCLKCKCARTPGQPPHPPSKVLKYSQDWRRMLKRGVELPSSSP